MGRLDILDLDAFRALHPWPNDLLTLGKPLEWLWYFDMSRSVDELWPYLVDTSRLNRSMGVAEMRFTEREGALHGESRMGGFRLTWRDEPWDWVSGHTLQNIRRYQRGPVHVSRAVFRLDPLDAYHTRYYVYVGWIPRHLIGALWLRIGMPWLERGYTRVIARLEQELPHARSTPPLSMSPPEPVAPESHARLAVIREALRERVADRPLIDRLLEYVLTGDEIALYRIQVLAVARRWAVDEDQLLRLCLHATREGLLTMSWDVICPHCRGVRHEAKNLGEVPQLGTCEVCDIDFSTDKENAVEITFHVHPAIRDIPKRFFCSAEPAFKMHIGVQRQLGPGAGVEVTPRLQAGRYRMRLKGEQRYRFLELRPESQAERVVWAASGRGDLEARPEATICLVNDTEGVEQFVIESAQWSDSALRPARLFNFQDFRDLFSQEYLAADVQLAVGDQTILFTDVVGSTRFYASRGDPEAFSEIKKHFSEIYAIVGQNRGAVVKTIGDAVMAAFTRPLDAVKAARCIHERFHRDRTDTPIRLRISLNAGPCIAVNLNSNIDYFGSTVNMAAKLQACADAGDIAIPMTVAQAPGVAEYLAGEDAVLEELSYHSDALGRDIPVLRWSTFADMPMATAPRLANRLGPA